MITRGDFFHGTKDTFWPISDQNCKKLVPQALIVISLWVQSLKYCNNNSSFKPVCDLMKNFKIIRWLISKFQFWMVVYKNTSLTTWCILRKNVQWKLKFGILKGFCEARRHISSIFLSQKSTAVSKPPGHIWPQGN